MSGKTPNLFFAVLLLSAISNAIDLDQEYQGYSENINQTYTIEYMNETYLWVDYVQFIQYSGSLLIRGDEVVRDPDLISKFSMAYVIHKNYDKQYAENLRLYSKNLNQICGRLSSLQEECIEMVELSEKSAYHLELSIESFSPPDAEGYYLAQREMMGNIELSLQKIETENSIYREDYREALESLLDMLKTTNENLEKSSEMIMQRMEMKIKSKEQGSDFVIILGAAILILVILSFIWIKR
jgi:hypothetical protein